MPDFLKPYISRIIAGLVATVVGWLVTKGINLNGETQQQLISTLIAIAGTIFSVIYAIIHKLLDKTINPTDGAAKANIEHGEVIKAKSDAMEGK